MIQNDVQYFLSSLNAISYSNFCSHTKRLGAAIARAAIANPIPNPTHIPIPNPIHNRRGLAIAAPSYGGL